MHMLKIMWLWSNAVQLVEQMSAFITKQKSVIVLGEKSNQ